ncbi:MAG: hypothetical protein LBP86_10615 [Azoarcus sp.]|jgi:hypothetical protein|nr:hypothetical protein [Azoarcus sp.]
MTRNPRRTGVSPPPCRRAGSGRRALAGDFLVILGDFHVVHSDFHVFHGDFHVFLGDLHEVYGHVHEEIILKIKDLAFSRRDSGGACHVADSIRRARGAKEK